MNVQNQVIETFRWNRTTQRDDNENYFILFESQWKITNLNIHKSQYKYKNIFMYVKYFYIISYLSRVTWCDV